ncbi:hypothetical protein [Cohnella fermenti]|uniref:Uncharacterized protein n=1 Tax=Cohnella fermenti TaxID=2565925 RepID=A0A4S4C4P7_9BACL|nr:hypothetical protein [Cohnella fermenti]THF82724.1 hypothetical protein E6C55_06590 [Cohnella fermenti]
MKDETLRNIIDYRMIVRNDIPSSEDEIQQIRMHLGEENKLVREAVVMMRSIQGTLKDTLCMVEGTLYYRDYDQGAGNPWYYDDSEFSALNAFFTRFTLFRNWNQNQLHRAIELGIQRRLIPSLSQDVFDSVVTADILCKPGYYVPLPLIELNLRGEHVTLLDSSCHTTMTTSRC